MTYRPTRRMLGVLGLSAIVAAPFARPEQAFAEEPGRKRHPSTVFVSGDSTGATWPASAAPKAGWGQALPVFLDPRRQLVENFALSGASSKSFIEAGLLDTILAAIRPGDHLLISFGHNDEKTDARHTDPFTTYQEYLTRYIDGARARGARPVLATPVERRRFTADGHAYESHGDYPRAMRELGAATRVPVIDLTALSLALWERLGVEETKNYFLWLDPAENPNYPAGSADNTHFQAHGAIELARVIVSALVDQHVLCPDDTTRLRHPVPDSALNWPESITTP